MKEEILRLRKEGKTYGEIKEILGCSKGTISYHCGKGQKEKLNKKRKERRKKNPLMAKVEKFKYRSNKEYLNKRGKKDFKTQKDLNDAVRNFQQKDNSVKNKKNTDMPTTFSWEHVLCKFGENTSCYLSGEKINLYENNYQLDHIIPFSKNGGNNFENLGILHTVVNKMKGDLTPDEFISWCIKILKNQGYDVIKK